MADLVAPIGTRELAKKLGKHPCTAWRRLKRIQQEKGEAVVSQGGRYRPLRTSLRALFQADPHLVQLKELEREEIEKVVAERFRARTTALERTNADLVDKVKSLELQLIELRKQIDLAFRGLRILSEDRGGDSTG